jgi:hypothetical protein
MMVLPNFFEAQQASSQAVLLVKSLSRVSSEMICFPTSLKYG